jgi:hypothetical protein
MKIDQDGGILWQKMFGGRGINLTDDSLAIDETVDGGYTVVGETTAFGAGVRDIWVLKLDSNGNTIWQKTYGGDALDAGRSIQQTEDGGYIVAGITYSFSKGEGDAWILKLSSNGSIVWQRTYGELSHENAYCIQQTSDGGYIVGGDYRASAPPELRDFWILKLDSNGEIPNCSAMGTSDAIVMDTSVVGQNTTVIAQDTSVTPSDTSIIPQNTLAETSVICASVADPLPDIKANASDGPLTIPYGSNLTVTVALDPGTHDGEDADWWVTAKTPFGRYWYTPKRRWVKSKPPIRAKGGPLFNLAPYEVLNSAGLPVGIYKFHFGVDLLMNGALDFDELYFDRVDVTIESE